MKNAYQRIFLRYLAWALCCCLTLPLFACTAVPVADDGTGGKYLSRWADGSYALMYELLDEASREAIDEQTFAKRYTDIYDGVGITKVEIIEQPTQKADEPSRRELPFTLICHSNIAGEMRFDMVLPLVYDSPRQAWRVGWSEGLIFPGMEAGDTVRVTTQTPVRGEIFSSDSALLAKNTYEDAVYVSLTDEQRAGNDDDTLRATAAQLAALLDMQEQDIQKLLLGAGAKRNGSVVVTSFPPKVLCYDGREGLSDQLRAQLLAVAGVSIDSQQFSPIRYYPYREMLSHLIGYTGVVTKEDLEAGRALAGVDRIGRTGLEAAYEQQLRGTTGCEVAIYDAAGKKKSVLYQQKAVNGVDLTLSIDMGMQQYAEALMKTHLLSDQTGVAIVMDPNTGMILALATEPSFDLNTFLFPIPEDTWKALNDPENGQPLFSRAIQGLYPPGSTIKPFTAAMALEAGAITPDYVFTGEIVKNKWTPNRPNWYYPAISRAHGYDGPVNLFNAMTESDNIFFADITLKAGQQAVEAFFGSRLGLAERMPFDVPLGISQISTDGTLADQKLMADTGYGQGELLVSPLQLIAMFTALANDGDILRPHVVAHTDIMEDTQYKRVSDTRPEVWKQGALAQSSLDTLLPIMEKVVTVGTGVRAAVPGMTIYGKTGTAEVGSDKSREIGWFVAFTKGENARLILVMIDGKTKQAGARMDIARELFKYGTDQQSVKPEEIAQQNAPTPPPQGETPLPTASPAAGTTAPSAPTPTPTPTPEPEPTPDPAAEGPPEGGEQPDSQEPEEDPFEAPVG